MQQRGMNFWLGNGVLGLALLLLVYMGPLWERFGVVAMALWAIVAGLGAYLVTSDKDAPKDPD